ncbi:SIR2 family protein [Aliarcobacter cryaerophilus]|uniref:SIR2 family protein n=1 Tax=Aliarcobacter cryaerophilus TaxID=28198 RepID=UPI003DA50198
MNERYIQSIIDANNDNRLALFIGSGISKSSDTNSISMPLWGDVVEELKKDLPEVKENDFLKFAQLYFLEFGEFLYYEKLKKIFDNDLEPSDIHKLIFEINPAYVITTNWDKLLDNTISNNAFIYDTVVNDTELVKSTIQKKLIKMHGDFDHHNIVFKEDDYLNYQTKFPLIENFIKSILSTHTVVFLGYSYSDYNLKQIMKWIQSFSSVKPPVYKVGFSNRNSEIKYLENHGIKTLVLDVKDSNDKEECNSAIKEFLLKVKTKNFYKDNDLTDSGVVNYFYDRLLPLDQVNVIMPEQIQKIFEKTHLRYEKEFIVIDFIYLNKSNEYYKKFSELLLKIDKEEELDKQINLKMNKIFEILSKAGIGGIMFNEKEYCEFKTPLYNGLDLSNIIDFKFDIKDNYTDLEQAYIYYKLDSYESSYKLYEKVIKECLKTKNYVELFLSMANRNTLLKLLSFEKNVIRNKYKYVKDYDIEEKYQNVPNTIKQAISPIVSTFKDFNFIYSFAFEVSTILEEKEKQKKSIQRGSIIFSNTSYKMELKLENLLYYTLGNGISIDVYSEFKTIIEYFIKIAIVKQSQEDNITLNKLELFSCIKYLKDSNLELIFEDYINKDEKKRFEIDTEKQKFLLKLLANIVKHIREDNNSSFHNFENYWQKTMFLFSIAKLEERTLKYVLEGFIHVLKTSNNSISIYKTINKFLGLQYSLYEQEIDSKSLITIVELVLNKIIYKNYNWQELEAIKSNYISNIYGYIGSINNSIFDNEQLVNKFITELNDWEVKQQVEISKYFLISLYFISNENIKDIIKDFIQKIDFTELEDENSKIQFELFLLKYDFDNNINTDALISKIENAITDYKDGKSFSTILFNLKTNLEYLVKEKEKDEFESIYTEIKALVDNYEKQKNKSIF